MNTPDDKTLDRIIRNLPARVSPDFDRKLEDALAREKRPRRPVVIAFRPLAAGLLAAAVAGLLAMVTLLTPDGTETTLAMEGVLPEEVLALADQMEGIDPESFDDFRYLALSEVF